jgi:RimJ/RimL family protein N-acetyltransferase/uncharacterized damage-inducible protein DinB
MISLQTDRLLLREPVLEDFESYAAMWADPSVMRYLSQTGKPMTRHEAWRAFTGHVGHWSLRGFGMFAVMARAGGEFVGLVGPWLPEGWPDLEIGWTLRPAWWGRGYATEAANACLQYAFNELQRTHVVSLITPDNAASIRVAERLGEALEGEVTLPNLAPGRKVLQYGLSREQWQGHSTSEVRRRMDLLDRLLGHDAWTTRQLLLVCENLTDEQLERRHGFAHGSVRDTLRHIIFNMEVWTGLMAGRITSRNDMPDNRGMAVNDLVTRLNSVAESLYRLARSVQDRQAWDETWVDVLDTPPVKKTYGAGLAHILTHSTHHRAQALLMLRELGVQDLPEGDVFSWENAGRPGPGTRP